MSQSLFYVFEVCCQFHYSLFTFTRLKICNYISVIFASGLLPMSQQGIPHQGIPPQGMPPQGMPMQPMQQQVMGQPGMTQQGMQPQGMPQQGMPSGHPTATNRQYSALKLDNWCILFSINIHAILCASCSIAKFEPRKSSWSSKSVTNASTSK